MALAACRWFEDAQAIVDRWLDQAPGHVMATGSRVLLNALRGRKAEALACLTDRVTRLAWEGYGRFIDERRRAFTAL